MNAKFEREGQVVAVFRQWTHLSPDYVKHIGDCVAAGPAQWARYADSSIFGRMKVAAIDADVKALKDYHDDTFRSVSRLYYCSSDRSPSGHYRHQGHGGNVWFCTESGHASMAAYWHHAHPDDAAATKLTNRLPAVHQQGFRSRSSGREELDAENRDVEGVSPDRPFDYDYEQIRERMAKP